MSIDYTPHTMVGWEIEDDEDPRIRELYDNDFEELDELASLIGDRIGVDLLWGSSLAVQRNCICCDEGWVIGVPMTFGEPIPVSQFGEIGELELSANEVWDAIYDGAPPSEPSIISFVQTW